MQVFCSTCRLAFDAPEGATGVVCRICRGPLRVVSGQNSSAPSQRRGPSETSDSNARTAVLAPLPPRTYSEEQDESGRLPFANAVKALHTCNASAFIFWLDRVFERNIEDAYMHVALQYRVVWARCALNQYAVCREFGIKMSGEIMAEIEGGLHAIGAILSYDALAPIKKVKTDYRFPMVRDAIEDASHSINSFRTGSLAGCNEAYIEDQRRAVLVALIDKRSETLFKWSADVLICEPEDETAIDLMLTDLARCLATLSVAERGDAPELSRRFADAARRCAAVASANAMDYPNMINAFKQARLPVPPSTPQPRAADVWVVSRDGQLKLDGAAPAASAAAPAAPAPSSRPLAAPTPVGERELMKGVEKSLLGLVGLEDFKPQLAMDIVEFLGSRQSRGRVFWGSSGVGKTEVAQRLAGLREGFPQLRCGVGQVRYVSGVDGKLEVKEIVDGLPPFSMLFIDEADKSLDPRAGMVTAAEATQLRHAIVTHFQRKPIFWVFLGVFAQMRSDGGLTDEALRVTFGDELAHRLDYADWGFPDWTRSNLLKAVSSGRNVDYENEAVLVLADYCIKSGGGVRAFDNLEIAIVRHLRTTKQPPGTKVSLAVAREILAKRGVRSAV